MSNSESCPLIPRNFPRAQRTRRPPQPLAFVGNYLRRRGKCCAFFRSTLVGRLPISLFAFSQSSIRLSFFSRRVFGDELWFWGWGGGVVIEFSLTNMFWKNSLDVRSSLFWRVAFENPFSGANFCFSSLVVAFCFLVVFCLCFCFMFRLFAPGHVFEKFSWCQVFVFFLRVAFENKFSGANFCFSCLVVASCFFVVFCLCFCFMLRLFAPGHVLEKFSWCQVLVFGEKLLLQDLDFCFACFGALQPQLLHGFFFFGSSPGNAGVKFSSCRVWFPATSIGTFSGASFCFKVSFSALRVLVPSSHGFCTVFRLFSRKCFLVRGLVSATICSFSALSLSLSLLSLSR